MWTIQSISPNAIRLLLNSKSTTPYDRLHAYSSRCQDHPATLQISDVHYIDVIGTASGLVANGTVATLECSAECVNITATGTELQAPNGTEPQYLCANMQDETLLDFHCTDVPITKG